MPAIGARQLLDRMTQCAGIAGRGRDPSPGRADELGHVTVRRYDQGSSGRQSLHELRRQRLLVELPGAEHDQDCVGCREHRRNGVASHGVREPDVPQPTLCHLRRQPIAIEALTHDMHDDAGLIERRNRLDQRVQPLREPHRPA
jgi:hypothetical protein